MRCYDRGMIHETNSVQRTWHEADDIYGSTITKKNGMKKDDGRKVAYLEFYLGGLMGFQWAF
jgi:hypothetical protein